MLEIWSLLLPVFAIVALGRIAVIARLLDASSVKSLNDFALWIALPALLFRSLAEAASLHIIDVAAVYLVGCLIVYAGAGLIARFWLTRSLGTAVMLALNATYGNIIYLGTPVVAMAFGPPGVAVLVGIIALHSGILLPITSILFEFSKNQKTEITNVVASTAKSLLSNPILISIVLGMTWHELGIPVPGGMHAFLSMLGAAATPLALFCVGASLPRFGESGLAQEAALPILLKLFILPPVVAALAVASGISGVPLAVAIIAAAMPTGANAFLLSRRVASFAHTSASTVVVTTVISLATLSSLLIWIR